MYFHQIKDVEYKLFFPPAKKVYLSICRKFETAYTHTVIRKLYRKYPMYDLNVRWNNRDDYQTSGRFDDERFGIRWITESRSMKYLSSTWRYARPPIQSNYLITQQLRRAPPGGQACHVKVFIRPNWTLLLLGPRNRDRYGRTRRGRKRERERGRRQSDERMKEWKENRGREREENSFFHVNVVAERVKRDSEWRETGDER